jgi:hypothetical protein
MAHTNIELEDRAYFEPHASTVPEHLRFTDANNGVGSLAPCDNGLELILFG